MKATVNWKGNMAFVGESDSGSLCRSMRKPTSVEIDSGARPMELIALGLAGCTAMDVISILQKKTSTGDPASMSVWMRRGAEEYPKVFTSAVITYIVTGKV